MTRNPLRLLVLTVAAALTAVALPATAQAAPYCGITWGSTGEGPIPPTATEGHTDIRAGRHACFDRLVVRLGGQDVRFSTPTTSGTWTWCTGRLRRRRAGPGRR